MKSAFMEGRTGELLRFAVIGVLNTALYYGFFRLLHLVVPYMAAHVVAFALCLTISFFLNCRFTFHVRPTWRRFVRFPLANLTTFVVMTLGVGILVEVVDIAPDVASLVIAVATVPITFVVSRLLLLGHLGARTSWADGPDL